MQADNTVGRGRALQILAGEFESPRSNPQSYLTHFRCKMDPEKKRTFSPWVTEPASIRSNNESEFVIEISSGKENKILPNITSLCSPQFQEKVEVEIFACDKINQSQGLIYIYDYNILDIEDYQ